MQGLHHEAVLLCDAIVTYGTRFFAAVQPGWHVQLA